MTDRTTPAASRSQAIDNYDAGRGATNSRLAEAPFAALAGGLAAGAVLAALLPKTRVEDRVLGPVTDRVGDAGRAAVEAARTAGRDKLDELNITRAAGQGVVQSVIDGLAEAARTSGRAALDAVRETR